MDNEYEKIISTKSLEELYDIRDHIDQEKYPERYSAVLARIDEIERQSTQKAEAIRAEPAENQNTPFNPWIDIWFSPRQTIRRIVDTNPTRSVILITLLAAIGETLDNARNRSMGDRMPLWIILGIALILGPLGGLLGLYIGGAWLRWTGSWFGGQATSEQVRAAIAWSNVPDLVNLAIWIPLLLLTGGDIFGTSSLLGTNQTLACLILPLILVKLGIALWGLVIQVQTLAEVHRFSAWRAVGAIFLPGIALLLLLLPCIILAIFRQ